MVPDRAGHWNGCNPVPGPGVGGPRCVRTDPRVKSPSPIRPGLHGAFSISKYGGSRMYFRDLVARLPPRLESESSNRKLGRVPQY